MRWLEALQIGADLLAAKLTGSSIPFHATLYVTTRCNLRCVYCSYPYKRHAELSGEEWCDVLDQLRELGTRRILFFGGEPLVRKDLKAIVRHARNLGFRCAMTSNGSLVPNRREIVQLLHTLTISIDGDASQHDRNRGSGSHEAAMRAIQVARSWGVPVKIHATLNINNSAHLEWLLRFSEQEGLPITLSLMRSNATGLYHNAAEHRPADQKLREILAAIVQAKKRHPQILFSRRTYEVLQQWKDFSVERLTRDQIGNDFVGPPCSAGRFHCAIYSNGDLFPCCQTVEQLPALNVRESGVEAALLAARDHGCVTCANACMLETNAMFQKDPRVLANLARAFLSKRLS